jgi:hypothetical protein
VTTPRDVDMLIGSAHVGESGLITEHGAWTQNVQVVTDRVHLGYQQDGFGPRDQVTCLGAAVSPSPNACHVVQAASGQVTVAVTGLGDVIDMHVLCMGPHFSTTGQFAQPTVLTTRDRHPYTLATARVEGNGAVSSDGDWITSASRVENRLVLQLAPVFTASPHCTCTSRGELADECHLYTAPTTTEVVIATRRPGPSAASADLLCIGPSVTTPDNVVSPDPDGTMAATASIQSNNAITWQDGRWIDRVTGGDGDHMVQLTPGRFAGVPRCSCTSYGPGGCTLSEVDDTTVHVRVTDGMGAIRANAFMLICVGSR